MIFVLFLVILHFLMKGYGLCCFYHKGFIKVLFCEVLFYFFLKIMEKKPLFSV